MSKDALVNFLNQSGQSEELAAALDQAFETGPAAVVALGADNNFDFTEEEINSFQNDMPTELSEDDLDSVAGGGISAGHKMIGVEAVKAFYKYLRGEGHIS